MNELVCDPLPALVPPVEASPSAVISLPPAIPVLPLIANVIYPGALYPLTLQGPHAEGLLAAVAEGPTPVGLFVQCDPDQDAPALTDLHPVGTAALLYDPTPQADGSVQVMVQGLVRVRLGAEVSDAPYFVAEVAPVGEPTLAAEQAEAGDTLTELEQNVREQYDVLLGRDPAVAEPLRASASALDDPLQLAYLVAATLPLDVEQRQTVLEADGALGKLGVLLPILDGLTTAMQVGQDVQHAVQQRVRQTEREYVLREQLKAIQHELGLGENGAQEGDRLAERLAAAGLPAEAQEVATRELDHLAQLPPSAPEHAAVRTYLEWLADLPWRADEAAPIDLAAARAVLDHDHYGLAEVKTRILEYLAVHKLRQTRGIDIPASSAHAEPILCFVGPPGVGKTSLGSSIAAALGRPFVRLSLGGVHDEAEIRGHRRTYQGAQPGRILAALRRVGTNNPVFMLDELDKLGTDGRGDPAAALLEVLDPEQQPAFRDHYLDVGVDLSNVLFIATANLLEAIPPALRDRLEVIELAGYTDQEKREIACHHLVPRQMAAHALTPADIDWDDDALLALVNDYTREAGVRELDRQIATLCRRVAGMVAEAQNDEEQPYVITPALVGAMLGRPRYVAEVAETAEQPGVATGLVWTPVGGDIVFIEASQMPGGKTLTITGQLGEVMKESAQAALTWVRSRAAVLGIDPYFFDTHDIHLHVPAGAVPKDGPSAGVTLAAALTSLLTDIPIAPDVAMTGELTLRGRVLAVGGVKEKVLAARRAGLRRVILPARNARDLDDLGADVCDGIELVLVDNMDEVLAAALVTPPQALDPLLSGHPLRHPITSMPPARKVPVRAYLTPSQAARARMRGRAR